jgi:hypothetical protein
MAKSTKTVTATKAPKTSKSKEVVVYDEAALARYAQEGAEKEKTGTGSLISIKNSKFSFQGNVLGTEIEIVIIGYVFTNKYYDGPYIEDDTSPPACFAIATSSEDLKPHKTAPAPQGDEDGACAGCWANQYESDARAKGKACKNTRQLAVISADDLKGDMEDVQVAFMSIPPTSVGAWKAYVNKLSKGLQKPTFAVVTKMSFDTDYDYPRLAFSCVDKVDRALLNKVVELYESVKGDLMTPPDVTGYVPPEKRKSAKGGKNAAAGKKGGAVAKKSKFG